MTPSKQGGPSANRMRVLLADGCPAVCSQFREALRQLPFVEIVGEAGTSDEALARFFQVRPDVVVISVVLPGPGGFEVLRDIKRADAATAVILMCRVANRFVDQTAGLLGAAGVCPHTDGFLRLRHMLQSLRTCDSAGHAHQV
jgi:DNA-binding NarL/FixJ family response regulator